MCILVQSSAHLRKCLGSKWFVWLCALDSYSYYELHLLRS